MDFLLARVSLSMLIGVTGLLLIKLVTGVLSILALLIGVGYSNSLALSLMVWITAH